jgi:membrane associated rhomboid family serine protease
LGLHIVLGVLLYRFLKLHRVLVQRKELDDRWHHRPILSSLSALLAIYGVVGSLFATGIIKRHRVDNLSEIVPSNEVACTIGITELTISMSIAALLLITLLVSITDIVSN